MEYNDNGKTLTLTSNGNKISKTKQRKKKLKKIKTRNNDLLKLELKIDRPDSNNPDKYQGFGNVSI